MPEPAKMKFFSRPYNQRVALIPMTIAIIFFWVLVVLGFNLSFMAIRHHFLFGPLMLVGVSLLTVYLMYVTYHWIEDSKQRHELIIDNSLVTLLAFNKEKKTHEKKEMSLTDVTSAEYYSAQDVSNLLLQSSKDSLEIPLWEFGPDVEKKIVSFVKSKGVKVTGIPY